MPDGDDSKTYLKRLAKARLNPKTKLSRKYVNPKIRLSQKPKVSKYGY